MHSVEAVVLVHLSLAAVSCNAGITTNHTFHQTLLSWAQQLLLQRRLLLAAAGVVQKWLPVARPPCVRKVAEQHQRSRAEGRKE